MTKGLIYKITCDITDKCYIGQTRRSLDERIKEHKRNSKYKNYPIHKAIRKYGWDSFKIEILEDNIPLELLNEREIYYTEKFKALTPNGYVLVAGGEPRIVSKETREKMSLSNKGQIPWNKGLKKCFSKETIKKRCESRKGKYIGKNSATSKSILCYDLNDNFIKKYDCIKDASRELNLDQSTISKVCRKKRNFIGNYKFKYCE